MASPRSYASPGLTSLVSKGMTATMGVWAEAMAAARHRAYRNGMLRKGMLLFEVSVDPHGYSMRSGHVGWTQKMLWSTVSLP